MPSSALILPITLALTLGGLPRSSQNVSSYSSLKTQMFLEEVKKIPDMLTNNKGKYLYLCQACAGLQKQKYQITKLNRVLGDCVLFQLFNLLFLVCHQSGTSCGENNGNQACLLVNVFKECSDACVNKRC